MRSLIIETDTPIKSLGKIYAKEKNTFRLLKSFDIDRSNFNLNVGFVPDAPLVISLPENQADVYKFEMSGSGSGNCTVELSSKPYIEYYAEKHLRKCFQLHFLCGRIIYGRNNLLFPIKAGIGP